MHLEDDLNSQSMGPVVSFTRGFGVQGSRFKEEIYDRASLTLSETRLFSLKLVGAVYLLVLNV